MQVETPPPNWAPEAVERNGLDSPDALRAPIWTLVFFLLIWILCYGLSAEFPFLKNGSDLVFQAKWRLEEQGAVFPPDAGALRVIVFGNSKVLAGFIPSLFDRMAAGAGLKVSSFNSGFPGSDVFLPPLKAMCERGQAPDILFLTLPWKADPPRRDIFHFVPDDHAVIEALFPFRNLPRDFAGFLLSAPSHGGPRNEYREARRIQQQSIADRGYHLIVEQSRFPDGRLPDDFHLASDQPGKVYLRTAPAASAQIGELNRLTAKNHIRCFYLPSYLREGEAGAPPAVNASFAAILKQHTSCGLLGPDYYLYPNAFFSDQTHLNAAGARVYTQALFRLAEGILRQGRAHALQ